MLWVKVMILWFAEIAVIIGLILYGLFLEIENVTCFLLHHQNFTPLAGDIRKHLPYINEKFDYEYHRLQILA